MIGFLATALVVAAAVVLEIVVPGRGIYHTGWYNVLLIALVIVTVLTGRKAFRSARGMRVRFSILAIVFGVATTGLAGVANGLLAPDNQTIVGAPGARIRVENLGVLAFPLASASLPASSVTLERPFGGPMEIGARSRDAGNFILHTSPRDVVYVEARDLRGGRLTITQPTGAAFLSPVLLMEHRQTIAGMDLPFDSFNLPAVARVVKAVLFTPAEAAMLVRAPTHEPGRPAVLFAMDDMNERPLPHGIALSSSGRAIVVGGVWLRPLVAPYPAVAVVSAPNVIAVAIGTLLVVAGLVGLVLQRD